MFTVLVKEWLGGCEEPREIIYEAARVEYFPSDHPTVATGLLLWMRADGDAIHVTLAHSMSAYVMNASGKTVATYHGPQGDPLPTHANADPSIIAQRPRG